MRIPPHNSALESSPDRRPNSSRTKCPNRAMAASRPDAPDAALASSPSSALSGLNTAVRKDAIASSGSLTSASQHPGSSLSGHPISSSTLRVARRTPLRRRNHRPRHVAKPTLITLANGSRSRTELQRSVKRERVWDDANAGSKLHFDETGDSQHSGGGCFRRVEDTTNTEGVQYRLKPRKILSGNCVCEPLPLRRQVIHISGCKSVRKRVSQVSLLGVSPKQRPLPS